jgi:hypothetical protein
MEAESSFETLVTIYQRTQSHISYDLNLHQHRCENLKSNKAQLNLLLFIYFYALIQYFKLPEGAVVRHLMGRERWQTKLLKPAIGHLEKHKYLSKLSLLLHIPSADSKSIIPSSTPILAKEKESSKHHKFIKI